MLDYSRNREDILDNTTYDAISYDAVHTAKQLDAALIVAFTSSGTTALRVAKYRPKAPILGVTPEHIARMVEARFGGLLAIDPTVSIGARPSA